MRAKAKVQTFIILALLFPVIHPTESLAQETDPSSETVTLVEKVEIPVEVNGKEVGKTSLPAGTKVTVVSRDGARVSIKRGNLGPVWVEASQLSGLSDKKPEQPSTPVKTDPAIELQKLNRLVSENKWAQVAAVCETIAQADEKFSGLAELAGQLKSALQAQTSAVQQQKKAEIEAKRLRRNADVVGQPSRLNPSDNSPMERAQKLREQADYVIREVKDALDTSEAQIAQVGTEISTAISRGPSEIKLASSSVEADKALIASPSRQSAREAPIPQSESPAPTSRIETNTESASIASSAEVQQINNQAAQSPDAIKSEAERGNAEAQYTLGTMHAEGKRVSQDLDEAVKWYRKAAEQDHALAQYELGGFYSTGKGIEQDFEKAASLFRQAAEKGVVNAQYVTGLIYNSGKGTRKNTEEALKWFRKAADAGHLNSQCDLAVIYAEGSGVPQDLNEAVNLFRKAADQGHTNSQYFLGMLYYKGEALVEDRVEAAKWFRKAADQGHLLAQNFLARMYRTGDGVNRDSSEAAKWFRKAAEQGNAEAKQALEEISSGLTGEMSRSELQELARSIDRGSLENMKSISKVFGGYTREEIKVMEDELKRIGR